MKKILCVILTLTILMTVLTSCGNDERLIGTWETKIDLTDSISQGIAEDEELAQYIHIEGFLVTVLFTFRDDGTYTIKVDEDGFSEAYAGLALTYASGLRAYLSDVLEAQGSDMTVDEVVEKSGTTLEEMAADSLDMEAYKEAFLSVETEGNYKTSGDKLYTTDSLDAKVSKNVYDTYAFSEDGSLKFLEAFGGETTGLEYPVTLTKKS